MTPTRDEYPKCATCEHATTVRVTKTQILCTNHTIPHIYDTLYAANAAKYAAKKVELLLELLDELVAMGEQG